MSTNTLIGTIHPDRCPWALLRLFQLVSPALPVGAYAYSQGLEYAVQADWVRNEAEAFEWLSGLSRQAIGTLDLPVLQRLYGAWESGEAARVARWNDYLLASRETAELRLEDRQLGAALRRILAALDVTHVKSLSEGATAFATCFALAGVSWRIECNEVLLGYLWAWTENQVLASVKLIPLGQSAGQRLLHRLIDDMPSIAERAAGLSDDEIGVGAISQVLAAALHETQYTRLFRS
jgi:urease accessory protein